MLWFFLKYIFAVKYHNLFYKCYLIITIIMIMIMFWYWFFLNTAKYSGYIYFYMYFNKKYINFS